MLNFLLNIIASALVIAAVYFCYWFSYKHYSAKRAYAECWWLSRWNCFRLVIRNMHDKGSLTSIHFRAWIRKLVPSVPGSSVNTFIDQELTNGERIILPSGQDLPVLCFRFENHNGNLIFVQTDKQGKMIQKYEMDNQVVAIVVEYSVKIRSWFLFKHEIVQMYDIPHKLDFDGKRRDLFREYILPFQDKKEGKLKIVFRTAQEVAVSI